MVKRAGITLLNARLNARITHVRICAGKIDELDAIPRAHDAVVDLEGDRVIPGFINCHDHLALNSLPPHIGAKRYSHAHDWILEVDERRRLDAAFAANVEVPREERLLIGGMKNLLSGVTTVAHHDPLYPYLTHEDFPIHVVRRYGWSHSLYIEGEDRVRASHRATPPDWPWIIHVAEGVNDTATGEFSRLQGLGCLTANTLMVHGVALHPQQRRQLIEARAGLIWCPSSNLNLFGKTTQVAELNRLGHVGLGTDSRLSGCRDLLQELQIAREVGGLSADALERMVTKDAARLLRLGDRGSLQAGMRADLVVMSPDSVIGEITRAELRLVMIEGKAIVGDAELTSALGPQTQWSHVLLDKVPKTIDHSLAQRLSRASISEAGLEIQESTWRAA